jgi:hypothetical protein
LDRGLGGPQGRYGSCGEEKNIALPGIELGPSSPEPVAIPIELSRLQMMTVRKYIATGIKHFVNVVQSLKPFK